MGPQAIDSTAKDDITSSQTGVVYPSPADFFRFLVINPFLVDGGLWSDYYSKDVIMAQGARVTMVLPDKKPLPNLVIRDSLTAIKK